MTLSEKLVFLYGAGRAPGIEKRIIDLVARYKGRMPDGPSGWTEKDVLLITYGDTITSPETPGLRALNRFLAEQCPDLFSFVHPLPFYPYTSDDGFAVTDFRKVREDLGTWGDIQELSDNYRLVFDSVINHVSSKSVYMQEAAKYPDFMIALDPGTDTSSVLRTRNLPLLHEFDMAGEKQWLWTTFGPDQVDLNYANPDVLLEILDVLLGYAQKGASMLRLDAIPYLWKKLGTSCAHLPETHTLIKLIRDVFDMAAPHVLLLTETNAPFEDNLPYLGDNGDEAQVIYNFTLPPLILLSIRKGDATQLTEWAQSVNLDSPDTTMLNITATHDGIGMRPTEGLLPESDRQRLMDLARAHGGDITGKRNSDGSVSPYELNLNYFNAVNDPNKSESDELRIKRFMLSQAIPLAFRGIPAIYIQSLLGSQNNLDGVKETGRARSINRQIHDYDELCTQLADGKTLRNRVFGRYQDLLKERKLHTAFHPNADQEVLDLHPAVFTVKRSNRDTGDTVTAYFNVSGDRVRIGNISLEPWGFYFCSSNRLE